MLFCNGQFRIFILFFFLHLAFPRFLELSNVLSTLFFLLESEAKSLKNVKRYIFKLYVL